MNIQAIDHLTEEFYKCTCFDKEHYPDYDTLQQLFYGAGKMIDTNFDQPIDFTVQSYAQALMQQIEAGNALFFAQQETNDHTEIFGNIAQRASSYEYSYSKEAGVKWVTGMNYIQYIFTGGRWLITSMVWADDK